MKLLVTGGAGYIGSHTCKRLSQAGYEILVYDNLSTGHAEAVQWSDLVCGDLSDDRLLGNTLRSFRPDAVLHFAASAYVGESVSNPRKYFYNNCVNSLRLLDAMLESDCNKIVFSSTCAVYGECGDQTLSEDFPLTPINPYGDSKLFVEKSLRSYGKAYGLSWAALRYFNAIGADVDGEIGEHHDPETHLVPLVIRAALRVSPSVKIFGSDFHTPDGTAIRDYIHVSDIGEAHRLAVEYLIDGGESRALNLGTGHGASVREVIRSVEKVSGLTVPFVEEARRAGDPARLVACKNAAQRVLNWSPQFCSLDKSVQTAINWEMKVLGRRSVLRGQFV